MKIVKFITVTYALLILTWIAWSLNCIALETGRTEIRGLGGYSEPLRVEITNPGSN
jgi:hypothetical protein